MTEAAAAPPTRSAIERLLRPRSVAVVGASATPGALVDTRADSDDSGTGSPTFHIRSFKPEK